MVPIQHIQYQVVRLCLSCHHTLDLHDVDILKPQTLSNTARTWERVKFTVRMASFGWIKSNNHNTYLLLLPWVPWFGRDQVNNVISCPCSVNKVPLSIKKMRRRVQSVKQHQVFISDPLHAHGDAHPASNTERCHALMASSPLKRMQQGHQHSAAGHANGMAQRNGTTTHIHLRRGQKG